MAAHAKVLAVWFVYHSTACKAPFFLHFAAIVNVLINVLGAFGSPESLPIGVIVMRLIAE